ncbi:carboxypeptidase-like regulatory domain-containing protein [Winogradskyella sp. PAMC22761]|nr:carboxypeptidase-like regulatory domain-containing protein [Winogradskyella sp. PAMC22761]
MNSIFKLSLLFFSLFAQSQIKLSGIVKDNNTKEILEYANVGLKQSKLGVNSDENGNFNLTLPANVKKDTLVISYIGYKTIELPISESLMNEVFLMQTSAFGLDEVTIYSYNEKVKLGSFSPHHKIAYSFTSDSLKGSELGKRVFVEKPVLLKDIFFFVKENTFKSVKLRLNFYALDNKYLPTDKIEIKEQVIVDVTKKGKIKFDISDYNIKMTDHFLLSVEPIDYVGSGEFVLMGEWHSTKAVYRNIEEYPKNHVNVFGYITSGFFKRQHNQDDWIELRPHNLAIKINALEASAD